MIVRIYYWFLWFMGFHDKDNDFGTVWDREIITFMLRRSQQRMKLVWFILTNLTFAILAVEIFSFHRWYLIPVYLFMAWLYIHVLWTYKPRPPKRRG